MTRANTAYVEAVRQIESTYEKMPRGHVGSPSHKAQFFLRVYEILRGRTLGPADPVLDFGCGIGDVTGWLLEQGLDSYGADILEYWGADANMYGAIDDLPTDRVRSRLRLISPTENKLPFDDETFELVFSNQTLEHVFDYRPVFAEQVRVLKPGGLAIHSYPHGHTLIEPHTRVPLTALNHSRAYLAFWALLGLRNLRQRGLSWREVVRMNQRTLRTTNYRPKRYMLKTVEGLRARAYYLDFLPIVDSRSGRLYRKLAALGIGAIAKPLLTEIASNRVLVLEKPK